jgi:hypothetical protein
MAKRKPIAFFDYVRVALGLAVITAFFAAVLLPAIGAGLLGLRGDEGFKD